MTNGVKISELTTAASLDGTESLPVVQGGSTVKTTIGTIKDFTQSPAPASLLELKALTTRPATVTTQYRSTVGDGGGGTWVWRSGNQSANVTADPHSGVWVAPDADSTGASGAWQRQFNGPVYPEWFGASVLAADNTTAIQACISYAAANKRGMRLSGLFQAAGPFTASSDLVIEGTNPNRDGIVVTGTAGGISIAVPHNNTKPPLSGNVTLRNFGMYCSSAGAGEAFTITFEPTGTAYAFIPSLLVDNVNISGYDRTTAWWSSGFTITDGCELIFQNSWMASKQGDRSVTTHWIKLQNTTNTSAMEVQFDTCTFYGSQKAIWFVYTGQPAVEGVSFYNLSMVNNDYSIYVDGSSTYTSPYWTIRECNSESYIAAIWLKNIAQVFLTGNDLIVHGDTASAVVLTTCGVVTFGADNYYLMTTGTPSSNIAIKSTGTSNVIFEGGFIQNFYTGIDLNINSTKWTIHPFYALAGVTVPVNDGGSQNVVMLPAASSAGMSYTTSGAANWSLVSGDNTNATINVTGGSTTGYGRLEVGGGTGAYIDLKNPFSDDYDIRISTTGSGGSIFTNSGNLNINAQSDNVLLSGAGFGFNSAAAVGTSIVVGGDATGAVSAFGIYAQPKVKSDVTTAYSNYISNMTTEAASFTLTSLRHFIASAVTLGATSAVTNQYGFYAQSTLTAATNNYGFYGNLASGTGVWNFYANGTAANYFGGATTFNAALTYGGVTLSNSVTGTGSMVLSASPTLTGTATVTNLRGSSVFTQDAGTIGSVALSTGNGTRSGYVAWRLPSSTANGGTRLGYMGYDTDNVTLTLENSASFVTTGGSVVVGSAALATNATDGFLYVPTCAGTPTGTPTSKTGTAAIVYDTTNNKFYAYNGAWKSATFA